MYYWIAFLLGQLIHVLKRMNLTLASKANDVNTVGAFLRRNAAGLLVRGFFATVLFAIWKENPGVLNLLFAKLGFTLDFAVPLTKATAALFGFFVDSLLDWATVKLPWLRESIPAINGSGNGGAAAAGA